MRAGTLLVRILMAATALAACERPAGSPAIELEVYAASSLQPALEEIRSVYARLRPDVVLTITTDSSEALATRIRQGASADVFLSADATNAARLEADGFTVGDRVPFAANRLTIIVPADNPAFIRSAADLATPGIRIVAAGDGAPITASAKALVSNLARLPGYSADFLRLYTRNVVARVDGVAAIVSQIEQGLADAAIVYSTDSTSGNVLQVEVPAAANRRVTCVGVVTTSSRRVREAQAFLAWLAGEDGRSVLGNFGFVPPD